MTPNLPRWFARPSLAQRFLLGSLIILVAGMAGVGAWVSQQIVNGVIHRTASATALYVDSLIAPSLQDLSSDDTLSRDATDRLDWLFADTPLGQQIAVFQVWDRNGQIVYSTVPELVGQSFPVDDELNEALHGEVTADLGQAEGGSALPEDLAQRNLIEIYSPVRDRDSGQVIAAAEFYYATDDLEGEIAAARWRSWMVVGGATLLIYLLLAVFIHRVSNTIRRQQQALTAQVTQLKEVIQQNQDLHERVRGAAARTSALNERVLRRLSAELHDGPAQEISLSLLRLDHVAALSGASESSNGTQPELERELGLIQGSLRRSLQEVRAVSSGLLLPQLATLSLAQTLDHVVRGHQRRTGAQVNLSRNDLPEHASLPTKIALYRIVQEALNNAWRHADGSTPTVSVASSGDHLRVEVADAGPGFAKAEGEESEVHLGLIGMRERAESLGGQFHVESAPGGGTRVIAALPLETTGGPHA